MITLDPTLYPTEEFRLDAPIRLFVTGTDTGVGKTHASRALLHALNSQGMRSAAMKPVASGCEWNGDAWHNEDALGLQSSASLRRPYSDINPIALPEPTAPQIAARLASRVISAEPLLAAAQRLAHGADLLLVEGVGGWLAPLSDNLMQSDLARALGCQVVLVVGLRLGCLNHALLSERAILADRLPLTGWLGSSVDPDFAHADEYHQLLEQHLSCPWLGTLPYQADPALAADALDAATLASALAAG